MTNAYLHGYLAGYMHKHAQAAGNISGCASDNMCTGYQHPPEVEPYRLATIEERKAKRLKKKQKHDALIAGSQQEGEAMNPFQGQG